MSSRPKFFVAREQINNNKVTLTGSDVSHIRTVLRLKAGDSIQVISDSDKWLTVRLVEVKTKEVKGEVVASVTINVESPLEQVRCDFKKVGGIGSAFYYPFND